MPAPARTAIILQHVPHEGCGRLAPLLTARGYHLDQRELHRGDPLPAAGEGHLLVVMGGPMGVGDIGDVRFPFLAIEADLLRERLRAQRPLLGICLGAQLIAHAAGARVYPNQRVLQPGSAPIAVLEVGWGEVRWLGRDQEPALAGLAASSPMLHWHGDTFDLPQGAVLLGSTDRCPHQAFRLGHHAYALQFHGEVESDTVRLWCDEDAAYLERANGPGARARLLADTAAIGDRAAQTGTRLLNNILAAMEHGQAAR